MDREPPEQWVFVFEAEPGPVPPEARYRQLLKYARRRQGLKCVAVLKDVPAGVEPVELAEE